MLSVIMAVFNGEKYLNEAIQSVLDQTYPDVELVVVNDGSTDRTREILEQYSKRIHVIHLEKNQGAAHALNMAAKQAKGNWIAVHDADDISFPTRLAEQVQFLSEHPEVQAVGTLIECINGEPPVAAERLHGIEKQFNDYQTAADILSLRFYGNPICHGTILFSKELFEKVGGYNPRYRIAYDYDLWMRFMEISPIVKVPKVLYRWRVYEQSLHRKNEGKTCAEVLHISSKHVNRQLNQPKVAVIGSKAGCKHYRKIIEDISGLQVEKYLVNPSVKELQRICRSKLDGVIVLEYPGSHEVLHQLTQDGLIYNHNLFFMWNVFNGGEEG